jgi:hypothetical protein
VSARVGGHARHEDRHRVEGAPVADVRERVFDEDEGVVVLPGERGAVAAVAQVVEPAVHTVGVGL